MSKENGSNLRSILAGLGPGILFAGAAIGVSHLVQSTRAGAGYGFGLLWAVVLALLFKYPFFEYAHRYTIATGESLLSGYRRLGTWAVALFMMVVLASSFITLAAVTLVTAGLAGYLVGLDLSLPVMSLLVLGIVSLILGFGKYHLLDRLMKVMVLVLGCLTLIAVGVAYAHGPAGDPQFQRPEIWNVAGLTFLLALMGWMPAPLDIGVWSSLWILEKGKDQEKSLTMKQGMVDFHVGYFATAVLAVAFISFGALVMYGTGESFSSSGITFAGQLVDMYTVTLGAWSRWMIALVAFITMFSTTITVMDGYTRTLGAGLSLMWGVAEKKRRVLGLGAMAVLVVLALGVITLFMSRMKMLIDIVTVLAFLTAPVVALLNFKVVRSEVVPLAMRPGRAMVILSWSGIVFLTGFSLVWIYLRWVVG